MSAAFRTHRPPGVSVWRRFAIRSVTVVVLAVLIGAAWVLFRPPTDLQLTSFGAPVANASQTLRTAEADLRRAVQTRHGTLAAGAQCYFDQPASARADAAEPIGDRVFCGPVRFVDSDPGRPFLTYNLVATPAPDGRMALALGSQDGDGTSADPRPQSRLIRPDGAQPPKSDQVAAPRPPPALGDVLTTTTTLRTSLTPAPATAVMVGQLSGVRLVEYGFVDSYGWAESARTAPAGYQLIAFAAQELPGEEGEQAPDLSVRVDGNERGPLAATSDYVVAAVPKNAKQVDLVLTDSGTKQAISLLTGRPDAGNPAVTVRTHLAQRLAVSRAVKVRLLTKGGTGALTGTFTLSQVSLSYWAANGNRCPQPDKAWLHVGALLRLAGDRQPYGLESALISVTLPEEGKLPATNAAADTATGVDDVVQVPASVTRGSVTFSGSVTTSKGTLSVLTPVTVPFTIPAG